MIGTIRKHSKLLWGITIPVMIISLFFFFTPQGNNRGGQSGDLGSINGKPVTPQDFGQAINEFKLFYLFHYNAWPKASVPEADMNREGYIRLFLLQKASDLGIHVGTPAAAAYANQLLHSLGRDNQAISPQVFAQQILKPENMGISDFERFVRHDLIIQQLVQAVGSSGAFVTPSEADSFYRREHQELSSQIVFFSATNYLSAVKLTPAEIGQFYTNYLAEYRLPERVQINYVAFALTNFQAQALAELAKTNLDEQVEGIYAQYGAKAFPETKTPVEAKAKIRQTMIDHQALMAARAQANELVGAVFAVEPVQAETLTKLAKDRKLTVHTTQPFAVEAGPLEFIAPEGFAKTAFGLTSDEPFANPIVGQDAVYVIALAAKLPSEIPSLAAIRAQVTHDCQMQQAINLARTAGTNFAIKLAINMASGKSFAATSVAAGLSPQVLPPFSLSTLQLPELGNHVELNQVKQAAFTTEAGHATGFEPTREGGFVLYAQSLLPIDQSVMNAELPQFITALRRSRENEAFNVWLQAEAGHALSKIPALTKNTENP